MISTASSLYTPRLDAVGRWLSPLALRALLAWEFFESGREKLGGQNWFADLEGRFPFPFSTLPASLNWQLATWLELVGAVMLLLGLATRSVAYIFWVLTIVAIAAVHWPDQWNGLDELWRGYAITDQGYGNFKLPLLFLAMLLPLILNGAGSLSLDRLLASPQHAAADDGGLGWGSSLIALLLPVAALLPGVGFGGALLGAALLLAHVLRRRRSA
ncbi:DoxX family protein [Stenotrophomonas indicatrix]|uniref:HvfX family Cu-binding RiPP maturation protein n=1 Tax=Stenotrophomonas indicatrix TaxID=2045451 RepID=UPI0007395E7A|nr:DoxX family protein [Stenotrophomonas indicatrix]CRD46460.1 DoxX family protein [Stenotrophomonas indicatrix]